MEIERVNSEKNKTYDEVPENSLFIFKFKSENSQTYAFFKYELLQGKILPYSTLLKGLP